MLPTIPADDVVDLFSYSFTDTRRHKYLEDVTRHTPAISPADAPSNAACCEVLGQYIGCYYLLGANDTSCNQIQ